MKTANVKQDENGEYILEFDPTLIEELGWQIGDTLEWRPEIDGAWSLTKKETEFVLVETVSMFRKRYVVEVPVGKTDWAGDTVVSNDAKEFSQKHLDEVIVSMRTVTKGELLKLCDEDNDYAKTWNEEQKDEAFVTRMKDYD